MKYMNIYSTQYRYWVVTYSTLAYRAGSVKTWMLHNNFILCYWKFSFTLILSSPTWCHCWQKLMTELSGHTQAGSFSQIDSFSGISVWDPGNPAFFFCGFICGSTNAMQELLVRIGPEFGPWVWPKVFPYMSSKFAQRVSQLLCMNFP